VRDAADKNQHDWRDLWALACSQVLARQQETERSFMDVSLFVRRGAVGVRHYSSLGHEQELRLSAERWSRCVQSHADA